MKRMKLLRNEILTDEMLRMKSLRGTEPVQALCRPGD